MAEEQLSFEQRTIQRLEAELKQEEPVEQETSEETPPEAAESEDSVGALSVDESEDTESDLEEIPEEGEAEETIDWEKRAKDNQAAFTEKSEEVARLNDDVMKITEEYTRGKFVLDDATTQARQAQEFALNYATAKANQARNINLSTLPPDQVAQAQQFMQQAFAEEQQVKGAYDQFVKQADEVKQQEIQREAEVARRVLERQIPDFQNTYPDIIKHMVSSGMAQREAQEVINPAVIRAFYDSMQLNSAPGTVDVEKQTKAKPPKSRMTPDRPRDQQGRYKKAEKAFKAAPDSRSRQDSWEEKTRLRLAQEGKGR